MELRKRMEAVDTMLEEAMQHIKLLESTIALQWGLWEGSAARRALQREEYVALQAKRASWEQVHQGLTTARNGLARLELLEPPPRLVAIAVGE
jgi:hypothetical protein